MRKFLIASNLDRKSLALSWSVILLVLFVLLTPIFAQLPHESYIFRLEMEK